MGGLKEAPAPGFDYASTVCCGCLGSEPVDRGFSFSHTFLSQLFIYLEELQSTQGEEKGKENLCSTKSI